MKCLESDREVQAVVAEKVGDTEQPHPSSLHTSEAETYGIRAHNKRQGYSMDYRVLIKHLKESKNKATQRKFEKSVLWPT